MTEDRTPKRKQMAVRVDEWVPEAFGELTALVSAEVGRPMTRGEVFEKLVVDAMLARGKVVDR